MRTQDMLGHGSEFTLCRPVWVSHSMRWPLRVSPWLRSLGSSLLCVAFSAPRVFSLVEFVATQSRVNERRGLDGSDFANPSMKVGCAHQKKCWCSKKAVFCCAYCPINGVYEMDDSDPIYSESSNLSEWVRSLQMNMRLHKGESEE